MSANGKRRPPRPRIEMLSADASATEAAAVVAAVERFIADTAPIARTPPAQSAWQLAALREGVAARQVNVEISLRDQKESAKWQS